MTSIIVNGMTVEDFLNKVQNTVIETMQAEKEQKKSNPNYLTRLDVARKFNISLPTLNSYTKRGIIPAYRIGARVLYKEAEVENSLKKIKTK